MAAAIEEAHARGMKVTGHICAVTFREAADLGIDNLEHGFRPATDFVDGKRPDECPSAQLRERSRRPDVSPDDPDFKALVRHLVERGVAITSTLTGYESRIAGRPPIPESSLDAMAAPVREYYLLSWAALQETPSSAARDGMAREMARERAFVEAGGLLVAGTDPTSQIGHVIPGYSNPAPGRTSFTRPASQQSRRSESEALTAPSI